MTLCGGKAEGPNPSPEELMGGGGELYRYSPAATDLCLLVAALWLSKSRNSLGLSGLSWDSSVFSASGGSSCPLLGTSLVLAMSIRFGEAKEVVSTSQPCMPLPMVALSEKGGLARGDGPGG